MSENNLNHRECEFDLATYGVDLACVQCKDGVMVNDQQAKLLMTGGDVKFRHACSNAQCRHEEWLPQKYPDIRYRRKVPI